MTSQLSLATKPRFDLKDEFRLPNFGETSYIRHDVKIAEGRQKMLVEQGGAS